MRFDPCSFKPLREVDYETGKIGHASRSRLTQLANNSDSWQLTAMSAQLRAAQAAADPAVLHLDVQLLQDMVVLCLATALGGLLAALGECLRSLLPRFKRVPIAPDGSWWLLLIQTHAVCGSRWLLS